MGENYDKDKCAALIKEARTITAEVKCELGMLERQMGRMLDGSEVDVDEIHEAGSDPRETRGGRFAIAARVGKDVSGGKRFWQFWS